MLCLKKRNQQILLTLPSSKNWLFKTVGSGFNSFSEYSIKSSWLALLLLKFNNYEFIISEFYLELRSTLGELEQLANILEPGVDGLRWQDAAAALLR